MEVGLSPSHFVLHGDPAHLHKKGVKPFLQIFGPSLLWPNGWMHQMPLGTEVGLSRGDFVFDGNPARLPKRAEPPNF